MTQTSDLSVIAKALANPEGEFKVSDIELYLKEKLSNRKARSYVWDTDFETKKRMARRLGAKFMPSMTDDGLYIDYSELKLKEITIKDKTKKLICQGVIQDGFDIQSIGITEQNINDYKGLPPKHAMKALKEAWESGKFTDLVVLEPIVDEEFEEKKRKLVDPIFCGKNRSEPEKYYFIAGWLEDLTLGQAIFQNMTENNKFLS